MSTRFINPPTISKPPGYTHVVEATTPGRIVYVAGQLGLDTAGNVAGAPGDFRSQAKQTFENLKHALAAVGRPSPTWSNSTTISPTSVICRSFARCATVTSTHNIRPQARPSRSQAGARGRAAGDRSGCDPAGQGGARDPHASRHAPGDPRPAHLAARWRPASAASAFAHPAMRC